MGNVPFVHGLMKWGMFTFQSKCCSLLLKPTAFTLTLNILCFLFASQFFRCFEVAANKSWQITQCCSQPESVCISCSNYFAICGRTSELNWSIQLQEGFFSSIRSQCEYRFRGNLLIDFFFVNSVRWPAFWTSLSDHMKNCSFLCFHFAAWFLFFQRSWPKTHLQILSLGSRAKRRCLPLSACKYVQMSSQTCWCCAKIKWCFVCL